MGGMRSYTFPDGAFEEKEGGAHCYRGIIVGMKRYLDIDVFL